MQTLLRFCLMMVSVITRTVSELGSLLQDFLFISTGEKNGQHRIAMSTGITSTTPRSAPFYFESATTKQTLIPITFLNLKSMFANLRLVWMTAAVVLLSFVTSATFGQATVTSDKDDYAPRSNAVFTGAGFTPGET